MSESEARPARDTFAAALASRAGVESYYTVFGELTPATCEEILQFLVVATYPITLVICSNGGDADPSRAVVSFMELKKAEGNVIRTLGLGAVMSAGLDVFLAGTRGERYAHEDTIFMAHATQTELTRKEAKLRNTLDEVLLERYTKIKKPQRERILETGNWYLSAVEAIQLGVADKLLKIGEAIPALLGADSPRSS